MPIHMLNCLIGKVFHVEFEFNWSARSIIKMSKDDIMIELICSANRLV